MKPVYPKLVEDSTDIKKQLDSAARSVTDTITAAATGRPKEQEEDSVYVITKEKEKFNLDQDNYMWYFRDILVLPDVKLGMEAAKEEKEGTTATKSKQGFFSRLKNLFKRNKQKKDTTDLKPVAPPEENYDTEVDSTAVQSQPQTQLQPQTKTQPQQKGTSDQQPKAKGLFGRKKKSKAEPTPPAKKQEPKKDEKDGFE